MRFRCADVSRVLGSLLAGFALLTAVEAHAQSSSCPPGQYRHRGDDLAEHSVQLPAVPSGLFLSRRDRHLLHGVREGLLPAEHGAAPL